MDCDDTGKNFSSTQESIQDIIVKVEPERLLFQDSERENIDDIEYSNRQNTNELQEEILQNCIFIKQEYYTENLEDIQHDKFSTENDEKEYLCTEGVKEELPVHKGQEYDKIEQIYNVEPKTETSTDCGNTSVTSMKEDISLSIKSNIERDSVPISEEKIFVTTFKEKCGRLYKEEKSKKHNMQMRENSNCVVNFGKVKSHSEVSSDDGHKFKEYKCRECHKIYLNERNLKRHFETVHKIIKYYVCNECLKIFIQKENLQRHINSVHIGIKYECNQCHRPFSQRGHLQKHIDSLHKGNKYHCKECNKMFSHERSLQNHIDTVHEKTKKYECDECLKMFSRKEFLKLHINSVHIGIKRFSCNKCQKQFSQKWHLEIHTDSVHKGIKYECTECLKIFSRKDKLITHTNIVHKGIKTYECCECHKMFSRGVYLDTHINNAH